MKFMFAAVTCFLTEEEELTLMAPTLGIKATFIFVFNNSESKILASHTEGIFNKEQFEEAINLSKEETSNIFEFFSEPLLNHKR